MDEERAANGAAGANGSDDTWDEDGPSPSVERSGLIERAIEKSRDSDVVANWGCGRCPACLQGREEACSDWARRLPVPLGHGAAEPTADRMAALAIRLFSPE